jgi:hypothetical protein
MARDEIRRVIREFLALVDGSPGLEAEARLPLLLDRLAVATQSAGRGSCEEDHADPPPRDQRALRALVCEHFPHYGYYNVAESLEDDMGEARCVIGDAIDDLVDITAALEDVEWRWSNNGAEDALWHLRFGFRHHWGRHLRELQVYLHERIEDE